jgi:hypothetical protein
LGITDFVVPLTTLNVRVTLFDIPGCEDSAGKASGRNLAGKHTNWCDKLDYLFISRLDIAEYGKTR